MANIAVNITGKDESASSTMDKVGKNASSLSEKISSIGSRIGAVFGGIQLSALADKITDFAKESIEKLSETADSTRRMQEIMGGSAESVSSLVAAAEHVGVSSSVLMTSAGLLSKAVSSNSASVQQLGIQTKNADGSYKSFAQLLPEIADKLNGMSSSTEKAALVQGVFGRSGKQLLPLLAQGSQGIAALEEEAQKLGVTINGQTLAATWKYQQAQKSLQDAVQGLQMKLGSALYPILTKVMDFLVQRGLPALESMFAWLQKNRSIVQPIVEVLGILAGVILVVVAAQKAWAVAQEILDVAMDANPIGLLIVAIGLLIAAVVLIVQHWNVIWPWIQQLWGNILNFLRSVWNNIASFCKTVFGSVASFFTTLWTDVASFFKTVWTGISIVVQTVLSGIASFFTTTWNNLVAFVSPVLKVIGTVIGDGVKVWSAIFLVLAATWKVIWDGIMSVVNTVVGWIVSFITLETKALQLAWNIVWTAISTFFTTTWNNLVAFFTPIIQWVSSVITTQIKGAQIVWTTVWTAVRTFFTTTWNALVGFFKPIMAWLGSIISSSVNAIYTTWRTVWTNVSRFFSSIWNDQVVAVRSAVGLIGGVIGSIYGKVTGALSGANTWLTDIGRNLIQGLINGIGDMFGWVKSKIVDLGSSVLGWAKQVLGVHSPSTEFQFIGQMIGQGLVNGIESMVGASQKAMSSLVTVPAIPAVGAAGSSSSGTAGMAGVGAGGVHIGTFVGGAASAAQIADELSWMGRHP